MLRMSTGVKRALPLLLCAVVLFAQSIALSHAVWHAYQQLPGQEQDLFDSNRPDRPSSPELSKVCAFDGAFSQVLGAAPPATYNFTAEASCTDSIGRAHRAVAAAELPQPRSRGPPSLL